MVHVPAAGPGLYRAAAAVAFPEDVAAFASLIPD
jgi:hypothetical protein